MMKILKDLVNDYLRNKKEGRMSKICLESRKNQQNQYICIHINVNFPIISKTWNNSVKFFKIYPSKFLRRDTIHKHHPLFYTYLFMYVFTFIFSTAYNKWNMHAKVKRLLQCEALSLIILYFCPIFWIVRNDSKFQSDEIRHE